MPTDFGRSKKRKFDRRDIAACAAGRSHFKLGGLALGDMTVKQLAFWAISSPSDRHRIACVSCLLDRTGNGHSVRDILKSLEVKEPDNGGSRSEADATSSD